MFPCIVQNPNKELSEGGDLRERAIRRLSACLAILALTASLGPITDPLDCNRDCAYANEFTSQLNTSTWSH